MSLIEPLDVIWTYSHQNDFELISKTRRQIVENFSLEIRLDEPTHYHQYDSRLEFDVKRYFKQVLHTLFFDHNGLSLSNH